VALGKLLFGGDLAHIHRISDEEFLRAWRVFDSFADKDWSFTDCSSKVVMESLGIPTAFSFDQHFRQFGSVTVVPPLLE
jgi:predicted nucleic acid-binding protein